LYHLKQPGTVKTNGSSVSCKCGRYDRSKSAECRTKP